MRVALVTRSEDETLALGRALGRVLRPGDCVSLHGELGAGKTCLVRGLAGGAGADPGQVSSPTFIVMQEYRCTPGQALEALVHMDAYRLRGPDELETIGWDRVVGDLAARRSVAVVVEWAERIEGALGAAPVRLDVRLAHGDSPGERRVEIEGPEVWTLRAGWSDVEGLARGEVRRPTRCPITGRAVSPDSPTYPFADERARLADLGKWLSGSYHVPGDDSGAGEGPQE